MATTAAARRRLATILHLRRPPFLFAALSPPTLPPSNICPRQIHFHNPLRHLPSNPMISSIRKQFVRHQHGVDESDPESEDGEGDDGEDEEDEEDGSDILGPRRVGARWMTEEEKVAVADKIGYRVVGPLEATENPFKPYEPVFAVVQVGSHQFKVSNGDSIFTERLKYCEVNHKLVLNKVLMLGSATQTIIGRPILPEATVHAVVEEHALDAKVIIFKKKRRKNYRRTKGHRQELTKLRITDIQGIQKPMDVAVAA